MELNLQSWKRRVKPLSMRGFTLTEIAMVLIIIGLLMGFFMSATPALLHNQNAKTTEFKMSNVEAALFQFVMQNRRLPCPALGTATAGTEIARNADQDCTDQTSGVVPWVTLGLSEADILDGWDTRITYRVAPGLTRDNAMDMSNCDPAGNPATLAVSDGRAIPFFNCNAGCSAATIATNCTPPANFLAGKGLEIRDRAGVSPPAVKLMDPNGSPPIGAAFVLISHGENQSGGYMPGGGAVKSSVLAAEGSNETANRADQALAATYVDANKAYSSDATRFDDIILRPSIMMAINRAMLGARVHH